MKSRLLFSVLSLFAITASAAEYAPSGLTGYGSVGTQGLGVGIATSVTPTTNARIEFNALNLSTTVRQTNVNYDAKVRVNSISALYDWHFAPTMPAVRATAGLVFNDGRISGKGTSVNAGTYTFNGVSYAAPAGESAQFEAKFKRVAPYLGLGFGDMVKNTGFSFFGDVGAYYANPRVTTSLSPGLAAQVSTTDLAAETDKLQHDVNRIRFFPVARVGVSYRF